MGEKIALLSLCVFALHLPEALFRLPSASFAIPAWKDDPEMWFSTAYVVSLWCLLRFLRGCDKRFFAASLIIFIAAICFKEMSYTLPFVACLLLWHERKLLTHWRVGAWFFAVAAIAFAFRFWALGGMGERLGSNNSWKERWLINVVGGAPGAEILHGQGLPLFLACLAALALLRLAKTKTLSATNFWLQVALFLAAIFGLGISARQFQGSEDPFYYQLLGGLMLWQSAFYLLILMFFIGRFIINRNRGQVFGWLWVVLTYLPLMTSPIGEHAFYLPALGWSIWIACALRDLSSFDYRAAIARLNWGEGSISKT